MRAFDDGQECENFWDGTLRTDLATGEGNGKRNFSEPILMRNFGFHGHGNIGRSDWLTDRDDQGSSAQIDGQYGVGIGVAKTEHEFGGQ